MSRVVALSGAQGGGKSTLLLGLHYRGWALDEFRVSRAVQAQLGWDSLDRVMESVHTMTTFQEEVYSQKLQNDVALTRQETTDIVLTERSFADIAAYTTYWCWEHVELRNWTFKEATTWLTPYLQRCREAQSIYAGIILLPYMKHVVWQNDPNRAKPTSVSTIYEDVRRFVDYVQIGAPPFIELTAETVDDRVKQSEDFLNKL